MPLTERHWLGAKRSDSIQLFATLLEMHLYLEKCRCGEANRSISSTITNVNEESLYFRKKGKFSLLGKNKEGGILGY